VLGVAQPLQDDLAGGGGRDPAEPLGGVVPLAHELAVVGHLLCQHPDHAGLRSMSMRAWDWWPSVCLYAVSSAVSIASITVSKGMSLSRSIARKAAMSTFTSVPPQLPNVVSVV